jgi:uncharacterized protein (DUF433 family)
MTDRRLVPLGDGIYTVSETCRILGSSMTRRKIHYWLDTGLISGEPIERGRQGTPTLLTFRQMLEIRTVQHLRDELGVPLPKVREAFAWILRHVFENGDEITFQRGPGTDIIAVTSDGDNTVIPSGQGAFPVKAEDLTKDVAVARQAWIDRKFRLRPHLVADTRVLAGTPTVEGTRIETALIASFADGAEYDDDVLVSVASTYPHLSAEAIVEAMEFEGLRRVA